MFARSNTSYHWQSLAIVEVAAVDLFATEILELLARVFSGRQRVPLSVDLDEVLLCRMPPSIARQPLTSWFNFPSFFKRGLSGTQHYFVTRRRSLGRLLITQ